MLAATTSGRWVCSYPGSRCVLSFVGVLSSLGRRTSSDAARFARASLLGGCARAVAASILGRGGRMRVIDADFASYVWARQLGLLRGAWLVTGDARRAEQL